MHIQALSLGVLTLLASIGVHAQLPKGPYNAPAFGRPHGVDIGNKVCGGACVSDPNILACKHKEYRPQLGCFECCFSDDDLDHLDLDDKAVPFDDVDNNEVDKDEK
ncbi:hypothetical protein BDW75DRAFT_142046 [Aspergillus navahoensis]